MEKKYGSKREDIRAAIGPAIGLECFEVGRDVIEAMKALFTDEEMKKLSCTKENGKFLFDLPGANHVLMRKQALRKITSRTVGSAPIAMMIFSTPTGKQEERQDAIWPS